MATMPVVEENDYGIRPAGKPDECFYCHQKVGSEHLETCVVIVKRAKIRMTVEYETDEPWYWDEGDIEYRYNDGTWCANNAIETLKDTFDTDDGPCMCNNARFEVVEFLDTTPRRASD